MDMLVGAIHVPTGEPSEEFLAWNFQVNRRVNVPLHPLEMVIQSLSKRTREAIRQDTREAIWLQDALQHHCYRNVVLPAYLFLNLVRR